MDHISETDSDSDNEKKISSSSDAGDADNEEVEFQLGSAGELSEFEEDEVDLEAEGDEFGEEDVVAECLGLAEKLQLKVGASHFEADQAVCVVAKEETKWQSCEESDVHSICGNSQVEWVAKDSVGASGGLFTVWDQTSFMLCGSWVGNFSIVVILEDVADGFQWCLVNSYGPCDRLLKKTLLLEN
ncbi:hypothetical protein LINGRAHAP2_LOCUS37331 [Linum grandiflorum]